MVLNRHKLSTLLLAACLVGVSAPVAEAAPATTPYAVRGVACPDLMVVAARGSSEAPQGTSSDGWQHASSYADAATFYGVGQTNVNLFDSFAAAKPYQRVSLDSVIYPADAVPADLTTDGPKYLASVNAGAVAVEAEVARLEAACGASVRYVFTGYSQGAWVMHKALWKLTETQPAVLRRVAGIAFFGDPEFEPLADIVRDHREETAGWAGAATVLDPASRSVPPGLQTRTVSYCLPGDPVCQTFNAAGQLNLPAFAVCTAGGWQPGLCPHNSYAVTDQVAKAAALLGTLVPGEYLKVVKNTAGGGQSQCVTGKTWSFSLSDVGGTTGRSVPFSIVAIRADGSGASVLQTKVGPGNVAMFEARSAVKFTGSATATVNHTWPATATFALTSGPCAATALTLSAKPAAAVAGKKVTLTGKLTGRKGQALADRTVTVQWHAAYGDGQAGPYRTNARGEFRAVVKAGGAGAHTFTARYDGSAPTRSGEFASTTDAQVWVLPRAVPRPADGTLSSSKGSTFTGTARRTTLTGSGFDPGAPVAIALYPGPKLLTTAQADASGLLSAAVKLPRGLAGKYTLVAFGDGHALTIPIRVH